MTLSHSEYSQAVDQVAYKGCAVIEGLQDLT